MLKSVTTNRFRKKEKAPKKRAEEEYTDQEWENVYYEQLLQRTMEAQKRVQTAIDRTFPLLQKATKRRIRTRLAIQGKLDALANTSDENIDGGLELYHAAIRPTQLQIATINRAPLALTTNRNCSIDIYNMPAGTTTGMVLDAIAKFRPVGEIYDTHLAQVAVDHGGVPLYDPFLGSLARHSHSPTNESYQSMKHVCVARIRFKAAFSAARLFQIGNKPGLGLYIQGVKAVVVFTEYPRPSMENEVGTRVVIFRGPEQTVSPENLRRVWGAKFFEESTQRVILGPVDTRGIREVEWHFHSFWWGAEVAFSLFNHEYHHRGGYEARFGRDPCA